VRRTELNVQIYLLYASPVACERTKYMDVEKFSLSELHEFSNDEAIRRQTNFLSV